MRSNMPPRKPSCRPKGACTSEASPRSLVFFLPCFSLCRAYCASRLFDTLSRYTIFPISHHFPFCILPRFFMKAFAENASPMLVIKRICTDWSTGIKKVLEPFSIQAPFIFQTITYNITYKRHKKIPLRIFILRGNSLKTGGGGGSRTRVPTRSNEDVYMLISSFLFIVLCRSQWAGLTPDYSFLWSRLEPKDDCSKPERWMTPWSPSTPQGRQRGGT